jgi:hypothetical protein
MLSILLALLTLHTTAPPAAGTSPVPRPASPAPAREWRKLEIAEGRFTAAKLGLLEAETDAIATFLAIYAYRQFAEGVWQGDLSSHVMARRFLSLALHLSPQNTESKTINTWLFLKTRQAQPIALPSTVELFTETTNALVERLAAQPEQAEAVQEAIGYLSLATVELTPENEAAMVRAEKFLRKFPHEGAAWKELHQSKTPQP